MRKYIGDRKFYRMVLTLAIPMVLQNFITNFVNMLDNFMVGAVGTEQMSGVAIVNQLLFVFNITIFGAVSGVGIFTAQYYGKNDLEGLRNTLRAKLYITALISFAAVLVLLIFGNQLVNLYLHDSDSKGNIELTFGFAKEYLLIIVIGLIPFALSQAIASTLRETGQTFVPMMAGFAAVFINCSFNYLLIFGKMGFPVLGVRGAAIATVLSRYVELFVLVVYSIAKRGKYRYFIKLFSKLTIPGLLLKRIGIMGMPLMLNELFWATGMSLLSMSYSLFGIDVVAAYSISSTVINMFNVFFLSLGGTTGIIVGKDLGAQDFDKAVDNSRKLTAFSFAVSIVVAVMLFGFGGLIPQFYNTNEVSKELAAYFIRSSAVFVPFVAIANIAYFTMRSGGKVWITILFDSVFILAFCTPIAFSMYYIFKVSVYVCYTVIASLDLVKAILGTIVLENKKWLNNIVSD